MCDYYNLGKEYQDMKYSTAISVLAQPLLQNHSFGVAE